MRIFRFRKSSLLLALAALFLQTYFVLANPPAHAAIPYAETSGAGSLLDAWFSQDETLQRARLSLVVFFLGACFLGVTAHFSKRRADQANYLAEQLARLKPDSLSQQVSARWSEDIVPLKLRP